MRCLRETGREVEVQNYIDDTGVQVADVVVGFWDIRRWTLDQIRDAIGQPSVHGERFRTFGDLCWDVYAEVGRTYEARPETRGLRNETLHAMEEGGNARAAAAQMISAAITREHVATMATRSLTTCWPRESGFPACHLTRAFALLKERGVVVHETEGKARRLLGHAWLTGSEDFAG